MIAGSPEAHYIIEVEQASGESTLPSRPAYNTLRHYGK